jgi:hypothetical protein
VQGVQRELCGGTHTGRPGASYKGQLEQLNLVLYLTNVRRIRGSMTQRECYGTEKQRGSFSRLFLPNFMPEVGYTYFVSAGHTRSCDLSACFPSSSSIRRGQNVFVHEKNNLSIESTALGQIIIRTTERKKEKSAHAFGWCKHRKPRDVDNVAWHPLGTKIEPPRQQKCHNTPR